MVLVSIRSQIKRVADSWYNQYKGWTGEKLDILHKLRELNVNSATAEDVKGIIGNYSWAKKQECEECEKEFDNVVAIGGAGNDCDRRSIYLCRDCLVAAIAVLDAGDVPPAGSP